MAANRWSPLLNRLRHIVRPPTEGEANDGQLLTAYARGDRPEAFEQLVRRHSRMVFGVCRRILADPHNAEDAFQATFLVLARKARSVAWRDSIGGWLYGVACRTSWKARTSALRRQRREQVVAKMARDAGAPEPPADPLHPMLDEEINRLPEKYRLPIVFCYLEGRSNEEAAQRMRCSSGAVKMRLLRARDLLRCRLERRGVALSAAALAAALEEASAAAPEALIGMTLQAAAALAAGPTAGGAASTSALVLMQGVIGDMMYLKIKLAFALLLALAVIGVGSHFFPPGPVTQASAPPAELVPAKQEEAVEAVEEPPANPKTTTIKLPALAEEKTAPWGKDVEGLSCRIVVPAEVVPGQPIRAIIEVRNQSKQMRFLDKRLYPQNTDRAKPLSIRGPDGKPIRQSSESTWGLTLLGGTTPQLSDYAPLAPGETWRVEVVDLRDLYSFGRETEFGWLCTDALRRAGKYEFGFTYDCQKCPEQSKIGKQVVKRGGADVVEDVYEKPTKEQLAGSFAGALQAAPVTLTVRPLKPEDLTVHEWGVFTVFGDGKLANINRKAEWGTLPTDFYRQFPHQRLVWAPAGWDKPIDYFYTKQPNLQVEVIVKFREGAPVVWWPAAASPTGDHGRSRPGDAPPGTAVEGQVFKSLRWLVWLGEGARPSGNPFLEWSEVHDFDFGPNTPEWIKQARIPGAAHVSTEGTPIGGHGDVARLESERFIYYDGMVPAPDYLRCIKVTDEAVTVRNTAKFPVGQVFVMDRRATRKNHDRALAYRAEAIPVSGEVTIDLKPLDRSTDVAGSVRQALIGAGLFAPEADSILKIWTKDLLEADGLTAFFLLPQKEYDAMLPLEVTPRPAQPPVRVGIVHYPRFENGPRLRERVAQLIRDLDSPEFEKRDAAFRELSEMGPWAVGPIQEALAKKPSLDITHRLEALLQDADASAWLKQTVAPAPEKTGRMK